MARNQLQDVIITLIIFSSDGLEMELFSVLASSKIKG